ncbi:MAG: hypothetical protein HY602_00890 [Parcubacteria group bacterium]|nr:hypothetical protein [Parcubacteria group bacterium]
MKKIARITISIGVAGLLAAMVVYFVLGISKKGISDIQNKIIVLNTLNNTLLFFDPAVKKFLPQKLEFPLNNEKYLIWTADIAPNGNLYVPVSHTFDLRFRLRRNAVWVVNPENFRVIRKINTVAFPEGIKVAPSGKAYVSHGFEYAKMGGFAWTVLDTRSNKIHKNLKIPGSGYLPTIIDQDKIYIPIVGGDYGSSNLLMIDREEAIVKFFDEDFSQVSPQTYGLKDGKMYFIIHGVFQENSRPVFVRKMEQGESFFVELTVADKRVNRLYKLNRLEGEAMEFIMKDNRVYISYGDGDRNPHSGLAVFDLDKWEIIHNIDLHDDLTFSKNMILVGDKLYLPNNSRRSIDIVDTNTYQLESIPAPENYLPTYLVDGGKWQKKN